MTGRPERREGKEGGPTSLIPHEPFWVLECLGPSFTRAELDQLAEVSTFGPYRSQAQGNPAEHQTRGEPQIHVRLMRSLRTCTSCSQDWVHSREAGQGVTQDPRPQDLLLKWSCSQPCVALLPPGQSSHWLASPSLTTHSPRPGSCLP